MQDKRKIKRELYNCISISSNEELYPLQKWYNQLIEKNNCRNYCGRCFKNDTSKRIYKSCCIKGNKFFEEDVFVGELYEGELLEKVSEMDSSF